MHHIYTVSDFVSGGWERTNVLYTLFCWIIFTISRSRVAVGIDSVLPSSSHESPCILIVAVSHSWARRQGSTTTFRAGIVAEFQSDFIKQELNNGGGSFPELFGGELDSLCELCEQQYSDNSYQDFHSDNYRVGNSYHSFLQAYYSNIYTAMVFYLFLQPQSAV